MSNPLVSIATTAYNEQRWLGDCIKSVLSSTMPDFELLLYNDGSTDNTAQIMSDWALRDRRIRLLGSGRLGRANALRTALGASVGRFVGWVDADDLLHPSALEKCVAKLRAENSELVYTGMTKIAPLGHDIQTVLPGSSRPGLPLTNTHFCLIDKDLYDYVGGVDPEFACAMDLDLQLRCGMATPVISVVKEPLYFYRQHANSISRRMRQEQRGFATSALNSAQLLLETKNYQRGKK